MPRATRSTTARSGRKSTTARKPTARKAASKARSAIGKAKSALRSAGMSGTMSRTTRGKKSAPVVSLRGRKTTARSTGIRRAA